jgi:ribonuclease HI
MRVKPPLVSIEMLDAEYTGYVLSFDGAAKLKSNAGSASFVLWKLPGWEPSIYLEGVTVNQAEYTGMLQGLELVGTPGALVSYDGELVGAIEKLVVVGDSRIVVQQCQRAIGCNQPHLELLLNRFGELQAGFQSLDLIHVKREFNGAADYLAGMALRSGETRVIDDAPTLDQLQQLNRLPERLVRGENELVSMPEPVEESENRISTPVELVVAAEERAPTNADLTEPSERASEPGERRKHADESIAAEYRATRDTGPATEYPPVATRDDHSQDCKSSITVTCTGHVATGSEYATENDQDESTLDGVHERAGALTFAVQTRSSRAHGPRRSARLNRAQDGGAHGRREDSSRPSDGSRSSDGSRPRPVDSRRGGRTRPSMMGDSFEDQYGGPVRDST